MTAIRDVFWNGEQGRLRAGYRIVVQLTAFFLIWRGLRYLVGNIPGVPTEITSSTPLWLFLILAGIRLFRVLLSVWLAGRFLDKRPFAGFGLRLGKDWWIDLGFGMGLGMLLMGSVFIIEFAAGWVSISDTFRAVSPERSFILSILVFAAFFLCVGFSEELFYRGYHLTNVAEGLNFNTTGPRLAIVFAVALSSALFGAFHLGSPNINLPGILNIGLWGILSAIAYVLTGRLAIPIGSHLTWNLFQGNVFGFPVSGATFPSEIATFMSTEQGGPDLWTGGVFGPEAGLLCSCAIIAGILSIVVWVRFRQGCVKLHIPLAQPPSVK